MSSHAKPSSPAKPTASRLFFGLIGNKYSLIAAPAIASVVVAGNAMAQASGIFASGTAKGQEAYAGLKSWLQTGGGIAFVVCGLIWLGTGRANWRWAAAAAGGLFIGGFADQIANFFSSGVV